MIRALAVFLALLQLLTTTAYALDFGLGGAEKMQGPSLTSEFIYRNDTEEALIPVYLLGAVSKPGLYHIPGNMDVLGLLTLAGGTLVDAETDHVLVRGQGNRSQPRQIRFDLAQIVNGGEAQRVQLSSNDLVYVPPGKPASSSTANVLTAIGIVAGLLSIVATSFLLKQQLDK